MLTPLKLRRRLFFFEKETTKWVLEKIKGFSNFLGMSCDKFEKDIMAHFTSIEAN